MNENEMQKYLRWQTRLLCAILAVVILIGVFTCVSFGRMAKQMKAIDPQTIQGAVSSLKEAADNLQSLDMDKLNELIASLQQVASYMENTTSMFSGWFGRS